MKEYYNIKLMQNSLNLAMAFSYFHYIFFKRLFPPSGVEYVSAEAWKQISDPSHITPSRVAYNISAHNISARNNAHQQKFTTLNTVLNDYYSTPNGTIFHRVFENFKMYYQKVYNLNTNIYIIYNTFLKNSLSYI